MKTIRKWLAVILAMSFLHILSAIAVAAGAPIEDGVELVVGACLLVYIILEDE